MTNFVFVKDLEATMDLLEGRLNSVICPLCKQKISFQAVVVVMENYEKVLLASLPEGVGEPAKTKLDDLAEQHCFRLEFCRGYDELRRAAVGWIDRYCVPIGSKVISEEIERMTLEEKVGLITPFFLRVLKAGLDGYLPSLWKFATGSPEEIRKVEENFYCEILLDHLVSLRKLVVAQSRIAALPAMIDEHVPQVCLTASVLGALASRCGPSVDPNKDTKGFVRAYLNEYLCAAAHACAGVPNPRRSAFASRLATCWYLSKRDDVVFDDRALLSNEVIHRLIRFEDLWDTLIYRPADKSTTPDELKDVFALLDDFGFRKEADQLVRHDIFKITFLDKLTKQTKEQFKDKLLEGISGNFSLNHSPETSVELGVAIAKGAAHLLRNQHQEQALSMVDQALQKGKEADDPVAIVSICANTIEVLCKNMLYGQAAALALEALEFLNDIRVSRRPSLFIQIWNELGNVARYLQQPKEALKAYKLVEQINEVAPIEEEEREKNRLTVKANIGIIFREIGDYRSALEILKAVSEGNPKDAGLLHNLAILYGDLNLHEEAIRCLDRAVVLVPGTIRPIERSLLLFSRSQVRLAAGDAEAGLCDLREAYQIVPPENLALRGAIAAGALSFYPESSEGQQFVEECETLVRRLIAEGGFADKEVEAPFLFGSLCARLLRDGQIEAAREIFEPCWEQIIADEVTYDWKIAHLQGWLQYTLYRDERCWPFFLEAEEKIDLALPVGSNVQFAPFWLQDKAKFQDLLAAVALDLAQRGLIPCQELLGVYEFMNGREISARILGEKAAEVNSGAAILAHCSNHPRALELDLQVFFFIETESEARLAILNARDGIVRLLDLPEINISDLEAIKSNLRQSFKKANPADLSRLDRNLAGWDDLSRRLGATVAQHLEPGAHTCFLPGRAFTGLPLHLLVMPDGRRLVECNTVSIAPNFTILLEAGSKKAPETRDGMTIVTVTKAADIPKFKQNALKATRELLALLEPHTQVNLLQEKQADLAAVKKALGESSEMIFLCHGTTAGQDRGYGICIAAGGLLPPSILSVREVPEHLRFILNWEDIEQSPPTFVSIACSSGITEVAKGGVRFGLEQILFSSGTSCIISPLWDVDQETALYWVQAFYRCRQFDSACSIETAYQQACLETKRLYPHFYFWGPFMMNGIL